MKILFTICGRAGSKGIKNKNIKDFLGYPLPFYTVAVIKLYMTKNRSFDYDIVLNTDSTELIEMFEKRLNFPVEVINRDATLGLDNTSKVAVIHNSFDIMTKRKDTEYDMVIDLDITSPLRTVQDLENIIYKKKNSSADVVFSVTNSRRNPYFNMVKKTAEGYERVITSNFNSRQEAPEIFDMNASIYAYSPLFLMSGKGIFDGKCEITKMMDTGVLDLDHENDIELMEVIAHHLYETVPKFREIRNYISEITI